MKMNFGKHKGKNLKDIATQDASYIFWLKENNIMEITKDVIEIAERYYEPTVDYEMIGGDRD